MADKKANKKSDGVSAKAWVWLFIGITLCGTVYLLGGACHGSDSSERNNEQVLVKKSQTGKIRLCPWDPNVMEYPLDDPTRIVDGKAGEYTPIAFRVLQERSWFSIQAPPGNLGFWFENGMQTEVEDGECVTNVPGFPKTNKPKRFRLKPETTGEIIIATGRTKEEAQRNKEAALRIREATAQRPAN